MADGARVLTDDSVDISVTDVYTTSVKKRVGLSTLNIGDSDKRRAEGFVPFKAVMQNMKPGTLRFPGGIEASSYLWATAPSWEPSSHSPVYNSAERLPQGFENVIKDGKFVDAVNFDEFMDIASAARAEVTVVINFESMYTPGGPSKEILIETAVRWVRYCREKGYNVTFWEIGNETDMVSSYNGMTNDGALYGNDAKDFILAMKSEDPSILVGVNGFHKDFMKETLEVVGEYIDFFVIHPYPFHGFMEGYTNFMNGDGYYSNVYDDATWALEMSNISQEKKDSIFFLVTETGAIDWKVMETNEGWSGNDVGHTLGLFELIGRLMSYEKVHGSLVWTTHWVNREITEKTEIYNVLSDTNEYNAIAYGVLPWSHAGDGRMVKVDYESSSISAYALDNGNETAVMMMNKMDYPVSVKLSLQTNKSVSRAYVFYGDTVTSKTVSTEELPPEIPTSLKKLSITVVSFKNK